ncbi:biotin carboxylase [Streptomyces sp. NPDC001941]|uniref:ATP-grasp domain-containing protein n=1 Tax=Streptomyces sp. NPDC001941 TaxID=3154659 RepID=UPI00331C99C9
MSGGAGPGAGAGREHVVVLHRWRDRHARYTSYLDHATTYVTYVSTELGLSSVPEEAAAVRLVPATDRLPEVRAALEALVAEFGPASRLVALNEGDLDTAAELRAAFGLPGQTPGGLDRFRDKLTMVRHVEAAGVPVPRSADAGSAEDVRRFAAEHGWPVVVKPRRGTASRGVLVLHGEADLTAHADVFGPELREPRIVQSFVADPVLHLDGLWTGDGLGPWRAARYLNSCEEFTKGTFLGSIELDDPELLGPLGEFTARAAAALGDGEPWVFHMEAFLGSGPDGTPHPVFLEAGSRVGGAEIPFVWREVHGLDLMAAAVDIQLGRAPEATPVTPDEPAATAGWLLLPLPVPPPCRVTGASWDREGSEGGPYAHVVPEPGSLIPQVGGYEHVGGRFRFRGASGQEVEAAIRKTAGSFALDCEPLTPDAPRPAGP